MKQNITISVDKSLLKRARVLAAERGASISAILSRELARLTDRDRAYEQAKRRALARLAAPFSLGGARPVPRESLHDRQNLR